MNNFVAIDFETANADRSSICQIGITEVVDGILQPSKSWLVQPEGNDYDAFNIHFTVSNQKTPRIALNFQMYGKRYIHI